MKNISFLCMVTVMPLLFFSCKDKYEMPHTPGVYVDKESLNNSETLWNNSDIKNYSYTYTLKSYPPFDVVADVTVTDGEVSFILKEYNEKIGEDITDNDKIHFENSIDSKENLKIENIYICINDSIEFAFDSYNQKKDCYYANFTFNFIAEAPFISYCKREIMIMLEDLDGNSGYKEIKIENFEIQ